MTGLLKRYLVDQSSRRRVTLLVSLLRGIRIKNYSDLRKTSLHDFHVSSGGKMVAFAGWSMPMNYGFSAIESALHTRRSVSLFDVSHMLQMEVSGGDSHKFLEYISPIDLQRMRQGSGSLSLYTNENGGIIDDCIITRTGPNSFYIVSNAGCADKDVKHINDQLQNNFAGKDVKISIQEDMSLIALQGPKMKHVLSHGLKNDITTLYFMQSVVTEVFGIPNCRVTRCGYTGEDGVEISVSSSNVGELVSKLIKFDEVELAGLGSRDILRLEAGLCLYGNDISEETTPIEAGLGWCISKRRRQNGDFLGGQVIQKQLKQKPDKVRIGLISRNKRPIRPGVDIQDENGNHIGQVTSAGPSPTLEAYVAMAYVPKQLMKQGTKLKLVVRNVCLNAEVVRLPFVPSQYYSQ